MRRFSGFLILALGVPGASLAQRQPNAFVDSVATRWQQERDARKQLYLTLQAGLPVYWKTLEPKGDMFGGWGALTGAVGVKLNSRWAVQTGINRGTYWEEYDIYNSHSSGSMLPNLIIGRGRASGVLIATPVRCYYQLHRPNITRFAAQVFVGVTPQWQRFRYETAIPGQPDIEATIQERTTNVYATAGLAGFINLVPNADFFGEAALSQRFYTTGDQPTSTAFVPTLSLGVRFSFGGLPHRNSNLIN